MRAPSSASSPDPLKEMLSVVRKEVPPAGLVIDAVGGVLGGALTVMLTEAVSVAAPLSVTVSVMV